MATVQEWLYEMNFSMSKLQHAKSASSPRGLPQGGEGGNLLSDRFPVLLCQFSGSENPPNITFLTKFETHAIALRAAGKTALPGSEKRIYFGFSFFTENAQNPHLFFSNVKKEPP